MTLWKLEARKMFKRNRGVLIIALFLVAELAVLILGDAPVNAGAALYREQYLGELEKVEGPWTSEKAAFLENEARDTARGGEGFDVLYKQYLYVNEGKENRYFLDANGWAGLLADRALDLPLVAAVILLAVPVYCGEAAGGMEPLALTSRNGRRLFARHKIVLTLTVAAALSLLSDLVRLVFFAVKYGLPHGGYPMQSVESLGSAVKTLPLWGAETLAVGLRLLGAMELAIIALAFSALCGQFALSAFLGTAVAVLPWIGLGRSVQYALPLPSSFITAVGFIQGSEYGVDAITGQSVAVFREVGWEKLALTAAGALLIGVTGVLFIRKRYQTALSGGCGPKRKAAALCLSLALCLTLAGCAKEAPAPGADPIYNSRDHRSYQYNGLTVSVRDGELAVTDSSGRSAPLIRDALKSVNGAAYDANFYAAGNCVYLWRQASAGYGQKLSSDTGKTYITSLICVNLDTFTSRVVFERVVQHTVLGIDVPTGQDLSVPIGGDFFVDDRYVYLLGSDIRRVELRTGKVSALGIPSTRNAAFDGEAIYYINAQGFLTRRDTKTGETALVSEEAVSDFRLTAEGLRVTASERENVMPDGAFD